MRVRTQVFISYNHNDHRYAELLCGMLEERGMTCWYYDRDILANSYAAQIIGALRKAKVFVVMLTESANQSEHVMNEVAQAFEMIKDGLNIMPVKIDDVPLSDELDYYLHRQEQTMATTPPIEVQLERFAEKVLAVAGGN